jgi:hypothetical protein
MGDAQKRLSCSSSLRNKKHPGTASPATINTAMLFATNVRFIVRPFRERELRHYERTGIADPAKKWLLGH